MSVDGGTNNTRSRTFVCSCCLLSLSLVPLPYSTGGGDRTNPDPLPQSSMASLGMQGKN